MTNVIGSLTLSSLKLGTISIRILNSLVHLVVDLKNSRLTFMKYASFWKHPGTCTISVFPTLLAKLFHRPKERECLSDYD